MLSTIADFSSAEAALFPSFKEVFEREGKLYLAFKIKKFFGLFFFNKFLQRSFYSLFFVFALEIVLASSSNFLFIISVVLMYVS